MTRKLSSSVALIAASAVVSPALATSGGPDAGGYTFADSTSGGAPYDYVDTSGTQQVYLGDDDHEVVPIGFDFEFYGQTSSTINIQSNGALSFDDLTLVRANPCPYTTSLPLISPWWDDLDPYSAGNIGYELFGTAPNRIFIVEWWQVTHYMLGDDTWPSTISFEVKLFEADNHIEFHYDDTDLNDSFYDDGESASVGISAGGGTQLEYSCENDSLDGGLAISFYPSCDDLDGDGACGSADCDDSDAAVHPGAAETCDGVDQDCDGVIDNGFDVDGDGQTTCGGDCDDAEPAAYAGATEICDGVDNDCDGAADNLPDDDGDGDGGCVDCDDTDASVHSGATEQCDGVDNNCDGAVDEGFDADGDGHTTCAGDCDDSDASVYPAALELCDGVDNNCDGTVDEDDDLDGDGYSNCDGDCDDNAAAVYPGATEQCDGADNNCDGAVDEGFDGDGDGYTTCGGDCDDSDDSVHPSALEVPDDGVDQDCDGADATIGDDDDDSVGDDDDSVGDDDTVGDDDDTSVDDDDTSVDDDDTSVDDDDAGDDGSDFADVSFGCGCTSASAPATPAALLLSLVPLRRRR